MSYNRLYIYGLEVLNPQRKYASYGPLDVGRDDYVQQHAYGCQRCNLHFNSQELLAKHLWNEHPTKSPVLILGDKELSSTRFTVRNRLALQNLTLLNSQSIKLNDEPISFEMLHQTLKEATNRFFHIDVTNEGVTKRYELDVKIVLDDDINNIDQYFFDCFDKGQLTNEIIQTFIKLSSRFPAADEYLDALVNYLLGLQAKVGKASVITFEEYPEKLNQAFSVLSGFNSQLALAICDVIAFMTNALNEVGSTGLLMQVHAATHFLLTGQKKRIRLTADAKSFAPLPIDSATHHIIELINQELFNLSTIKAVENKVNTLSNQCDISPSDKDKLNLIIYRKSLELNDEEAQQKYARKLKHWDEIEQAITNYDSAN